MHLFDTMYRVHLGSEPSAGYVGRGGLTGTVLGEPRPSSALFDVGEATKLAAQLHGSLEPVSVVWALCFNGPTWTDTRFFSNKLKAEMALSEKKSELRAKAVTISSQSDLHFTFYIGWEERGGTWSIRPVPVE